MRHLTIDPIFQRSGSNFRRLVGRLLAMMGLSFSRKASKEDVLNVFRLMWPVSIKEGLERLGGPGDGGYLVPRQNKSYEALFSPGVHKRLDFEEDFLVQNPSAKCYLVDGSVNGLPPSPLVSRMVFEKLYLGTEESRNYSSLDKWVSKYYKGRKAVLQMDIEGGEYAALLSCSDQVLDTFELILIEFHGLNFISSKEGSLLLKSILKRLLRNFYVVHLHENNYARPWFWEGVTFPTVVEVTFARRGTVTRDSKAVSLPHSLDIPNALNRSTSIFDQGFRTGVIDRQILAKGAH